jgi:hypothetical protein
MIGVLRSREADVALSELIMTRERLEAIDFTFPLIFTRWAA